MIKRLLCIIISVIVLCAGVVSAKALSYTALYDSQAEMVEIAGVGNPRSAITLEVLCPGKTGEDAIASTSLNFKNTIYRIEQTVTDSQGNFKFSLKMSDMPTGMYLTRVNGSDGEIINYINKSELDEILTAVNKAEVVNDVVRVLSEYKKVFGTLEIYFDKLSENARSNVANEILEKRDLESGKKFENCSVIIMTANTEIVVEAVKMAGRDSEIDITKLLEDFESILKLKSLEIYQIFSELSNKNDILNNLVENAVYESIEDIRNGFSEYTVLYAPKDMRYDRMYDFILKYNNIFKVDLSRYNKLSAYNKAIVMREMVDKVYRSTEEFKNSFNAAVSSVYVESGSSSGGGGGGSSGGGGGSSSGGGSVIGTVNNPEPEISINTVVTEVVGNNSPFVDLKGYEWAEESVIDLYEKSVVNGKGNGMFCPGDYVSREEFVKMLICAMNESESLVGSIFEDVDNDAWYAGYVNKAYELGWVNGTGEKEFGVGVKISRQDIATILYRISSLKMTELTKIRTMNFADSENISDYASEAVFALANAGIINGDSEGNFAPSRSATRAETAKMVDMFLKFFE